MLRKERNEAFVAVETDSEWRTIDSERKSGRIDRKGYWYSVHTGERKGPSNQSVAHHSVFHKIQ